MDGRIGLTRRLAQVLRDSPHEGNATLAAALELAEEGRGPDESGYRTEFLCRVKKAQALAAK